MTPATCEKCRGHGLTIASGGEFAQASVCECRRDCKACGNHRYVVKREGIYDVAAPCECLQLITRVRLYNEAGVPVGYARKRMGSTSYTNRGESLERAREAVFRCGSRFNEKNNRGVVLTGGYGLGKTHLVCGLITSLTLKRGVACRFVDYYGLLARIRATFNRDREAHNSDETEASLVNQLVEVPVLVIDDLGKGQGSAWELSILDQIVTRRYNTKRLIVATTNYPLEKDLREQGQGQGHAHRRGESLEGRIGERLVSRLRDACEVVFMTGDDYRTGAQPGEVV